jgi:hypothetical protein
MALIVIGPQFVGRCTGEVMFTAGRLLTSLAGWLVRMVHPGTGCLPARYPGCLPWTSRSWEEFHDATARPVPPDLLLHLYRTHVRGTWWRW